MKTYLKFTIIYIVAVLILGGVLYVEQKKRHAKNVEQTPEVVAPAPTNPPLMWDDGTPERIKWSEWLREEIGAQDWSPQIQNECKSVELKECIAQTISAIAFYESSFNPTAVKLEEFRDASKDYVVSRGLFQLAKGPANQKAYSCGLETSLDLNDPLKSISCMVKIAHYWLHRDLVFWAAPNKGFGRYHSVARTDAKNFQKLSLYVAGF